MNQVIKKTSRLEGTILPPGDKSISHRAAILNAIAHGNARIQNYSQGADCNSTLRCLRLLGSQIRKVPAHGLMPDGSTSLTIKGSPLQEPIDILNVGNSGTTIRMLMGVLAAHPFVSVLTGDRSLRSRPMSRVSQPLQLMGAHISSRNEGTLAPIVIEGGSLNGIEYSMPIASAQVKSALLLAALFAQGETVIHQPSPSRDHTERMLMAMGATLQTNNLTLAISPGQLKSLDITIPGDISAAAFWMVAGAVHPNASLRLANVGMNPTRTGLLDVLKAMGAKIGIERPCFQGGEPTADLTVESSVLTGIEIGGDIIPRLIDELPALALAGCFATGKTVIRDAGELRVKESDRISTTVRELRRLGADATELPDGMMIRGTGALKGGPCDSHRDHRLAMTLGIAGLLASGATIVSGAEAATVSYPTFWKHLSILSSGDGGEQS